MISKEGFINYFNTLYNYMGVLNNMYAVIGLSDTSPLIKIENDLIDFIINECEIAPPQDTSNPEYWAWEPLIIKFIQSYDPESGIGFTLKTLPPQPENSPADSPTEVEPKEWQINSPEDLYDLIISVYEYGCIILNEE